MAAPCVTVARTIFKGVNIIHRRWLLTPAVCQCSRVHISSAASLCSSRVEPQKSSKPNSTTGEHQDDSRAGGEDVPEGPEYIPKKKAKNPMIKIGYAWMIGLPTGIITFLLAKRQVDKNRLKQLKIRQRMRNSNEGEYEGSRYHHSAVNVNLDK